MVFPYIISVGLIDPMSPTDQGDIRKLLKHDLECFNSDFCEKGKSDKCMGMLAERLDDFFCSREPECHEINLGKCTKDSGDQRDTDCVFGLVPIGARGNLVVTYARSQWVLRSEEVHLWEFVRDCEWWLGDSQTNPTQLERLREAYNKPDISRVKLQEMRSKLRDEQIPDDFAKNHISAVQSWIQPVLRGTQLIRPLQDQNDPDFDPKNPQFEASRRIWTFVWCTHFFSSNCSSLSDYQG